MNPLTLYCLDDDDDDLELFESAAISLGHKVSLFKSFHALMSGIDRKTPDAIFLDIHMPMVGGEEALGVLRKNENWKDIPVMMISSASPKKLVKYYLDLGALGILKKPHGAKWEASLANAVETILTPELQSSGRITSSV